MSNDQKLDLFVDLVKPLARAADNYNRRVNEVVEALYMGDIWIDTAQKHLEEDTAELKTKLSLLLTLVLKAD